jgi:hypothetical protein
MKNKVMKKAPLVGAVMLATASISISTLVQADSLLAPVVVNNNFFTTYLNIKVKGATQNGGVVRFQDRLHYVWLRKRASVPNAFVDGLVDGVDATAGLGLNNPANYASTCRMVDNMGRVSKSDMIFQATFSGVSATPAGVHADTSIPNSYGNAPVPIPPANYFVGMVVVSDMANTGTAGGADPEGDMSGFAYIVSHNTGDVMSYKLVNNHHSATEGDFSAGFISKHVVDLAWTATTGSPHPMRTAWVTSVTGADMTQHTGTWSSEYDATVSISQAQRAGEDSPQEIMGNTTGVYNNDELLMSGDTPINITCMGSFIPANFLDAQQVAFVQNGGWLRKSIIPQPNRVIRAGGLTQAIPTEKTASGAITYRIDAFTALVGDITGNVTPLTPQVTMEIETGGHLAPGANHANRPY